MIQPVAPGDSAIIEFIFTSDGITPYDPTPAPTVDVFETTTGLVRTQVVTDAVMSRSSPSKVGSYYYTLAVDSLETLGTGIEVIATTTDTGVLSPVRARTQRFVVGTVDVDLDPVLDELALIIAGSVTVSSPIDQITGDLTIIRGDSYEEVDGREISWTSTDWTLFDLSTALSVTFRMRSRYDTTVFSKAMAVVSDALVYVELLSTETTDFKVGDNLYRFDVEAILLNSDVITLAMGRVTVLEDVR